MPSLLVFPPGARQPKAFPVLKKITTLGADRDNDVVLNYEGVENNHGHILFDGKRFELAGLERSSSFHVGGKSRRSVKLQDGLIFECGDATCQFRLYDLEAPASGQSDVNDDVFRTLLTFSEALMLSSSVTELLNEVLDQVIRLTEATRGFIILLDHGRPLIRVARGIDKTALDIEQQTVSDSIVTRVLESGRPVVLKDALSDAEFGGSQSVINLKLCSVMCVPLQVRGEVLGLIYLGNDNVVNLFGEHALEVLTIYAAQAGLVLRNALLLDELQDDNVRLRDILDQLRFGEIIGTCPNMLEVFRKIERVATTDISVLIQGETGTGKELVAKEIHARSNRVEGPFVVINCGAIPDNLLESELFGHVRGAFTGAVSTTEGKFQVADGGTLFLDEIGELPLNLQVKLLRALQEHQVTKVGDTRAQKVDIRVVAATNKELLQEVRAGRFREDLYYRLNVIALTLPPLRDRGEDVQLLARYLLNRYVEEFNAGHLQDFSVEAVAAMKRYPWPGNIREMQNRVKKAVVFSHGPQIVPADMDLSDDELPPVLRLSTAKDKFQRDYINMVLALNDGNRTKTAKDLDVDPRTIFRHLEKERED